MLKKHAEETYGVLLLPLELLFTRESIFGAGKGVNDESRNASQEARSRAHIRPAPEHAWQDNRPGLAWHRGNFPLSVPARVVGPWSGGAAASDRGPRHAVGGRCSPETLALCAWSGCARRPDSFRDGACDPAGRLNIAASHRQSRVLWDPPRPVCLCADCARGRCDNGDPERSGEGAAFLMLALSVPFRSAGPRAGDASARGNRFRQPTEYGCKHHQWDANGAYRREQFPDERRAGSQGGIA